MSISHSISLDSFPNAGNWTREQLKLAFHYYCQTPFGQFDHRRRPIIELSSLIGRTPSALAMKLTNFASLDPSITGTGRSGLRGASALDREIWDEFNSGWERLAVECEQVLLWLGQSRGVSAPIAADEIDTDTDFSGETRSAIVQHRVKQNFFRRAILSSYRERCCVSGVSDPQFLVASHIVPWSADIENRLNPRNGLCLSTLHDRAFDSYLFALTDDFRVVLSARLKASKDMLLRDAFWPTEDKQIELPGRFLPGLPFIQRHRERMLSLHRTPDT